MAATGKPGNSGVVYKISGGGFHSPKGYSRAQRHGQRDEIEEALHEAREDAAAAAAAAADAAKRAAPEHE